MSEVVLEVAAHPCSELGRSRGTAVKVSGVTNESVQFAAVLLAAELNRQQLFTGS